MAVVDVVLPEEILIEEILTRLAVKSLVRFRCVCKSWNSQSYNPNFLSRFNHHHHHRSSSSIDDDDDDDDDDYVLLKNSYFYNLDAIFPTLSILSCKTLSETHIISADSVPYPLSLSSEKVNLVGSINGLVCIAYYDFEQNHQFIIWNPVICCSKIISMVGIQDINRHHPLLYGFGWDSVTNDYKLIAKPYDRLFLSAAVYSCKTDCWSKINDSLLLSSHIFMTKRPGVIVNGSPYWYDWKDSSVLKFDTPNNKFTYLMNAPSGACTALVNLNDCLAFVDYNEYRRATKVYHYEEQHNIWMHVYTIDDYYINYANIKVLSFKYGGEILFHGNRHVYLYDPKEHEIKSRCRCCFGCGDHPVNLRKRKHCASHDCGESLDNGFSYTPSLVALPGMKALHM